MSPPPQSPALGKCYRTSRDAARWPSAGFALNFLRKLNLRLNLHDVEPTIRNVLTLDEDKCAFLNNNNKRAGFMLDIIRHLSGKPEYLVEIGESAFWSEFKYASGTEIFAECETADYVYQIVSGAVRTLKLLPDGRRQIGAFYLPGDIFGVENGDAHRLTAEAIVDTKVLLAKRTRIFGELSEESLTGTREVLKLLTRSLLHAENHLLLLGRQSSVEKVAAFLIEMDRRLQSPGEIILPMNRRDIADYLGLTIESVSRALSLLRSEGLLSFQGYAHREIVLHHRTRLAQLAISSESRPALDPFNHAGRCKVR